MTNVHVRSTPVTAWQQVRDLITERKTRDLADCVIALTEAERAEVARRLPELRKEMRDIAARMARERWESGLDDDDADWEPAFGDWAPDAVGGFGEALRIAGAGTLQGPAAVAAWLTRREFTTRWEPANPAELVRVLAARPAGWQSDVAARLALKIRTATDRTGPLALALLRACGSPPPEHDPLVAAWLLAGPVDDDPLIGPLLPRIFEAEGAGRALREERLRPAPTRWLARLERDLAAGRVSREDLLDGCLRRFLRGGDAADLRFFVRLHELIDPPPEEFAARARDYLRLLPAAPGTVAELALAQLRRTGPHDDAEVVEAIGALTFRPEAKLAQAGLRWLDEEVRRAPGRAGDLAPALATAFAHVSYDIQRRAVRLALKHAAAFAPAAETIAAAVPLLPAALGAQAGARFGGEVAPADGRQGRSAGRSGRQAALAADPPHLVRDPPGPGRPHRGRAPGRVRAGLADPHESAAGPAARPG
ncbi:hypothetical protein ACTMTI_43390 [Nonomuraea sp. H19]|uniref:hypothetical protein n=1 Tax=Nonomuraea sp. H19 TaxID=3452206 RepID=UPI003F8908EF